MDLGCTLKEHFETGAALKSIKAYVLISFPQGWIQLFIFESRSDIFVAPRFPRQIQKSFSFNMLPNPYHDNNTPCFTFNVGLVVLFCSICHARHS